MQLPGGEIFIHWYNMYVYIVLGLQNCWRKSALFPCARSNMITVTWAHYTSLMSDEKWREIINDNQNSTRKSASSASFVYLESTHTHKKKKPQSDIANLGSWITFEISKLEKRENHKIEKPSGRKNQICFFYRKN